jgi:hypothetical protein
MICLFVKYTRFAADVQTVFFSFATVTIESSMDDAEGMKSRT